MDFSRPKSLYDPSDEAQYRARTRDELQKRYVRGESIELWPDTAVILRSPNGARWKIAVSNAGVLSATAA